LEPTPLSPLLLAHLLLVAACLWLCLHAWAGLQSPAERAKARALRVADRWS